MPALVVTEQVIHNFGGTVNVAGQQVPDGEQPEGNVTLSKDGNVLYGRTYIGGAYKQGTIFSVNIDDPKTSYSLLHSFGGTVTVNGKTVNDGSMPRHNAMALSPDGSTLYGMALEGGDSPSPGDGIVFSYDLTNTPSDAYQLVYSWQGGHSDGATPHGSVILAGPTMYGMTEDGGENKAGVLFEMPVPINGQQTPAAAPNILYNFGNQLSDGEKVGEKPHGTPILVNGILYGMTREGGDQGFGVLYQYDAPTGMQILHSFDGHHVASGSPMDGATPYHGNPLFYKNYLYGMTTQGGYDSSGNPSDSNGEGIIFRYDLNPSDTSPYTVLHYFGYNPGTNKTIPSDAANPEGSLTLANGTLYGVSSSGGAHGKGAFFSINPDGSDYTVLYSFDTPTGSHPIDSLTPLVHPDGSITFYGMTQQGGDPTTNSGVIFAITVANVPSPPSAAPTSVALTGVRVTPSLASETVALVAQVSSPAGTVNQGTVRFSVAGRTMSASVNSDGQATTSISLPAFTTIGPLAFGVNYTDASDFAASSDTFNVPFIPLDVLLPSSATLGSSGAQTVTDTLFGLLSLGRAYNAQSQLTGLSIDGITLVSFVYNSGGQLTAGSIGNMQVLALSYNSQGKLTSLVSPAFTEVFFYTPQGLLIGSMGLED